MRRIVTIVALALAVTACKTGKVADGVKSAGSAAAEGVSDAASAGTSLVNVNLSNVLNDLAVRLNIDKANIPVNAQIPITIAANVCGVSINVLSLGTGGQSQGCTAKTASPELAQTVQQQIAAGGSVGGGAQTTTPAPPTTPEQQQQQQQPPPSDSPQ
jgi:hypothetical protein